MVAAHLDTYENVAEELVARLPSLAQPVGIVRLLWLYARAQPASCSARRCNSPAYKQVLAAGQVASQAQPLRKQHAGTTGSIVVVKGFCYVDAFLP
eukprot:jgi/Tetstr1/435917/TSEL_024803.t1